MGAKRKYRRLQARLRRGGERPAEAGRLVEADAARSREMIASTTTVTT